MATPVSQLYELCQKLRIPAPIFTFKLIDHIYECTVLVSGIGTASGEGAEKQCAKQEAAKHLLDSSTGQSSQAYANLRYSWTKVENKTAPELAQILVNRTQATVELLKLSTTAGYAPKKRAEVRNQVEQITKQIGVFLADFET